MLLLVLIFDVAIAAWNFTIGGTLNTICGAVCLACAAWVLVLIAKRT